MLDGVKILLERMQTHPEEFHGDYNRWTQIINRFEKFFNTNERALINGALTNIRRDEFTGLVMQELLRESVPVEIDPNSYTIKTTGRDTWGNSTLSIAEQVLADKQKMIEDAYKDEIRKLIHEEKTNLTKAEKNKSKMQQLLQNVTKRRQVY